MGCVNIYKNIKFSLILILLFFICVGSISASEIDDNTDININSNVNDMELNTVSEGNDLSDSNEKVDSNNDSTPVEEQTVEKITPKKTSITVVSTSVARNNYLKFYIKDNESVGLSGVKSNVKINGATYSVTTNSKGLGQLKLSLTADKYYSTVIKFVGNDFYLSSSKSFTTKVIKTSTVLSVKSTTVIKGSYLYVILKDKNSKVLSNQKVYIKFNGKTYTKTTNSKGVASLLIKNAPAKTYTTKLTYKGNANYYSTSKSLKVKVVKDTTVLSVANTTVAKGKYLVVYLKTKSGKALASKKITININGKTFTKTTNSKGKASLLILSLTNGKTYTTTLKYKGNSFYKAASKKVGIKIGTVKTVIKSSNNTQGAIWVWGADLNNRDYNAFCKELASYNIKNIFLYVNEETISTKLPKLINAGKPYGVKVHAWYEVFHDDGWINPVYGSSVNQNVFNDRIALAKKIAKINGIGGIHLDYLRYPGDYGSQKKINAVTEFTRQLSVAVKKVNPNIILSAAVMPEIGKYNSKMTNNEYYYGQNITALAKYLDVICPMVYKGNYGQSSAWIKSTTAAFVKAINGNAKLWVGLQGYRSDNDETLLSISELTKDCNNALAGGADGIGLFRYTFTNIPSFKA